jgi:hypothetical protein
MATISLKITSKEDKKKVDKIYTAEGYDLMLGTVEDFMDIIDIDKLGNNIELAKMVLKGYGQLKPLIMDIFPELTDEEYRRIKVNDLIATVSQIGKSVLENLDILKSGKN